MLQLSMTLRVLVHSSNICLERSQSMRKTWLCTQQAEPANPGFTTLIIQANGYSDRVHTYAWKPEQSRRPGPVGFQKEPGSKLLPPAGNQQQLIEAATAQQWREVRIPRPGNNQETASRRGWAPCWFSVQKGHKKPR